MNKLEYVLDLMWRMSTFPLEPYRAVRDSIRAIKELDSETMTIISDGTNNYYYINGEHVRTEPIKPLIQQLQDIGSKLLHSMIHFE